MKYKVTVPEDYPRNPLTLAGLPALAAGESVLLELTKEQVEGLKRRGVKVTKPQPKTTKENGGSES